MVSPDLYLKMTASFSADSPRITSGAWAEYYEAWKTAAGQDFGKTKTKTLVPDVEPKDLDTSHRKNYKIHLKINPSG